MESWIDGHPKRKHQSAKRLQSRLDCKVDLKHSNYLVTDRKLRFCVIPAYAGMTDFLSFSSFRSDTI